MGSMAGKDLLRIADLTPSDVRAIWDLVTVPAISHSGTVAWSFEGNGIRTRTTFIQAFRELGLDFIELPNLLKTGERTCDLAGYLDPFYEIYVVRAPDHDRLEEFAASSTRPVINAMSSEGHPCEVLTDAYFVQTRLLSLDRTRICLWGPLTNVFRSWQELADLLTLSVQHVTGPEGGAEQADLLITDGWPPGTEESAVSLTKEQLARMGDPLLLPTPPFSIGRELSFDPLTYRRFAGYEPKQLLLPVQQAIIRYLLGERPTQDGISADGD